MRIASFVLLLGSVCVGQEPVPSPPVPITDEQPVASITITDTAGLPVVSEVETGQLLIVSSADSVHAHVKGSLTWIVEPSLQTFSADDGETLVINSGPVPTTITLIQIVSVKGGQNAYQKLLIRVGNAPNPPPDADPIVAPIVSATIRVLIVEETADRTTLPPGQQSIFASTAIRTYAAAKCSKGQDGKTPDFRIYDKDAIVAKEPPWIQAAWKEPRTATPWIVVSNGKQGYSGPLPASETETLALLKKYGGEP